MTLDVRFEETAREELEKERRLSLSLYVRYQALVAGLAAVLASSGILSAAPYNKAMPEEKASSPNFEASLEELERVVKELEKGDLPLEQSLALFESGMRLSEQCKQQLEGAESRVEILMKKGSEMVSVPFSPDKPAK